MAASSLTDQNIPDYKYENYYISGGYAYTEDHFMASKLFVYKIPCKTTVEEVREYFAQFGNIKKMRFVAVKDAYYPKAAFLHFESPTDAARVLNFYHKRRNGRDQALYHVKVCDSWLQPNCQFTKKMLQDWSIRLQKSGEEEEFFPPNRDSILVLNDDCLENIIRFLPISSQLHFARSCSRVREVYHMASKTLFRTLYLERLVNMTQWEIRDFFDFAGDYIIRIEGKVPEQYYQRIVKSMSIFCTNLEELDLGSEEHQSENNRFLKLIRDLRKLKTLKLSESFEIFGRNMKNIPPTIECLSVDSFHVEDRHIISLCNSLSNLKELNLGRSTCFNDVVANAMAVSCNNLETLTLGINKSDYGLIAKLPKLKNLTVFLLMQYTSCPSLFTQLVEHKSHQLEFLCVRGTYGVSDNLAQQISRLKALRIFKCPHSARLTDEGLKYFCSLENLEEINLFGCKKITNTALLNLVLKCMKLKHVDLEGCYLVTNRLIFELIQRMKKQNQNKRTEPVLLKAGSTNIQEDILHDPGYKASSHFISVDLVPHRCIFDS